MNVLANPLSDGAVLLMLHSGIVIVLIAAFSGTLCIQIRRRRGAIRGTASRGPLTMGQLWAAYGLVSAVCLLALQVSASFQGYKVILTVVDCVTLTYLFFFNSWFRKRVLLRVLRRAAQD